MKKLITNYTFDASAQQVTLSDYTTILPEGVLIIANAIDNILIYNFADTTAGGTVSGNVITLTYDTTLMDDTDPLLIFYDDGIDYPLTDTELRASDVNVSVEELQMLFRQLVAAINDPVWLSKTYNALQVLLLSGSTTAVTGTLTGVTTVTGLTNLGGYSADTMVADSQNTLWAMAVRSLLT